MATTKLRVVHYLNQFFGGLGGEEKADIGPRIVEGARGPGQAIQKAFGDRGEVVATAICGDNYIGERTEEAANEIAELMRPYHPDIVIAGPAFEAGRYGVACGAICQAVQGKLGVLAVSGMYRENPGVELYHKEIYIIETGNTVMSMNEAVFGMVGLTLKLSAGQQPGKPDEDGYFPRGRVINEEADHSGAERVIDMLLSKLKDGPFETEVIQPRVYRIPPAPRVSNIETATVALVTDGGLVPTGNPDGIETVDATRFGKYAIKGIASLDPQDYEVRHGGYDAVFIRQNPNRLVPLDIMRQMEKDKKIGKLHDYFFSTTGVGTKMENSKRMGQAIARDLKENGVSAAILTSTWGTSTRCGAVLTKELERAGIPTAHVTAMTPVAVMGGSPRIVQGKAIINPWGKSDGDPDEEKAIRLDIAAGALKTLQEDREDTSQPIED